MMFAQAKITLGSDWSSGSDRMPKYGLLLPVSHNKINQFHAAKSLHRLNTGANPILSTYRCLRNTSDKLTHWFMNHKNLQCSNWPIGLTNTVYSRFFNYRQSIAVINTKCYSQDTFNMSMRPNFNAG